MDQSPLPPIVECKFMTCKRKCTSIHKEVTVKYNFLSIKSYSILPLPFLIICQHALRQTNTTFLETVNISALMGCLCQLACHFVLALCAYAKGIHFVSHILSKMQATSLGKKSLSFHSCARGKNSYGG